MATASSLLSEEKFLCSVCLDVFNEPVSTPCGHNFCRSCIHKYWDSSDVCQCPLCKKIFSPKPELHVNTTMSELAAEFKTSAQDRALTPDPQLPETADILCDICSDIKEKAVKSCLMCLVSFCEVHLEPHQRVAALKSHTLINPVKNLDDRMCKTHNKITELYCRTDQACICAKCFITDHKGHNVVLLEEEYEAVMAKKDAAMADIQKMIQTRSKKMAEIENSVNETKKKKEASVQVFSDLMSSIQRSLTELVEVIEERYRITKKKAEGFLTELKMEVAELERRSSQLEQLSQSEDHHDVLKSFQTLCSPLNKNWTYISVHSDLSLEQVRDAVTLLKEKVEALMEELPEIKINRMREHAVDLTFDPDTAHRSLVINQDGKQVINKDIEQNLPHNPKRFEVFPEVLAKEGFTTGKFCYEVQMTGEAEWIVGVVRESVDRKNNQDQSVKNGYWAILCCDKARSTSVLNVIYTEKVQNMGIFVDYKKGLVSFYDVNSKSHIYSLKRCNFKEKIYPYFCLEDNVDGAKSSPLIITPVPQKKILINENFMDPLAEHHGLLRAPLLPFEDQYN